MKFDLPKLPFSLPTCPRFASVPGKIKHEYVWHCHILDHEEHDMMRPLVVVE
jgi:spore coat protein A